MKTSVFKKATALLLAFMMMFSLVVTAVSAADAATLTVNVDKDAYKPGETVTVTVTASGLNAKTLGITFAYDNTALEIISGAWAVDALMKDYNVADNRGVMTFTDAQAIDGDLFTLVILVKEGVEDGDYAVTANLLKDSDLAATGNVKVANVTVCDHANANVAFDDAQHWKECECGEKFDFADHVFENDCDTTCDCGYTRTIEHVWGEFVYDEVSHWKECACGEKAEVAAHVFDNDCDTTCDCGYTRDIEHNYETKFDANGHWTECACGDKTAVNPHVFGEWIIDKVQSTTEAGSKHRDCACGYTATEVIPIIKTTIVQKGRNLEYKDMIYVIDIFQLTNFSGIDLTTDAGLLSWSIEEFEAMTEITFDEAHAVPGLEVYPASPDKKNPFYYGKSEGIFTKFLGEERYYVGYVLVDGVYVFSDAKLYGPKTYAYNMIGKTSTDAKTKNLCVALLNYISAAQKYFNSKLTASELANAQLTEAQKTIVWNYTESDFNLAPDTANIPENLLVTRDKTVYKGTGKNLLFQEMISLVTPYVIDNKYVKNAVECGTIFWTADQFAELTVAPDVNNYGSGEKVVGYEVYQGTSGQWYTAAPPVSARAMADTSYYYLGYVKHADGTVSYSGIITYSFEQYIYNTVTKGTGGENMVNFAKALYLYERAAKAALN